jgi:hypothetical protein
METHLTTTLQVDHAGIHHIRWPSEDIGSFSMRYKSSIMVSVISIFEAFEFVTTITPFDYVIVFLEIMLFPLFYLGG